MQLLEERTDTNLDPRQLLTAVAKGDLSQTMALEINKRPLPARALVHRNNRQPDGEPT